MLMGNFVTSCLSYQVIPHEHNFLIPKSAFKNRNSKSNYFSLFFEFSNTLVAEAITLAISVKFEGMIIVLFFSASFPNSPRYCSATLKLTASRPPFSFIAEAISLIPFAVATATLSISAAVPSASFIFLSFSPSD